MQDGRKAVWSIPCVSVAFFSKFKTEFYCISFFSKVSDCIFEIHQLWQSGFSRVYSNCCCSCSFESEIIKIGQSSHKMYSNNTLNFQVYNNFKCPYKKKSWNLLYAPPTIGKWPAGYRRNRKEVIISRLRIGHTYITHLHCLKEEDPAVCSTCKVPLTVYENVFDCERFRQICSKHYQTNNLKDLFKNSKPEEILSFLKETNLFIKIYSNIKYNQSLKHAQKTKPI